MSFLSNLEKDLFGKKSVVGQVVGGLEKAVMPVAPGGPIGNLVVGTGFEMFQKNRDKNKHTILGDTFLSGNLTDKLLRGSKSGVSALPKIPTIGDLKRSQKELGMLSTFVETIGLATGQPEIVAGGAFLSQVGGGLGTLTSIAEGSKKIKEGDYNAGLEQVVKGLVDLKNIEISEEKLRQESEKAILNRTELILKNIRELGKSEAFNNTIENRQVNTLEDIEGDLQFVSKQIGELKEIEEKNIEDREDDFDDLVDTVNPPDDFDEFIFQVKRYSDIEEAIEFVGENNVLYNSFSPLQKRVVLITLNQI